MFENLNIFRMSHAMAVHAGARQTLLAQNMANADTPDYSARDVRPFADIVRGRSGGFGMHATRSTHLTGQGQTHQADIFERDAERDPNGNSVSLELEMLHAVDTKRQHDRALAIYKSSLGVLRASLGRR